MATKDTYQDRINIKVIAILTSSYDEKIRIILLTGLATINHLYRLSMMTFSRSTFTYPLTIKHFTIENNYGGMPDSIYLFACQQG